MRPELLAPAGDWDALRAAVSNGADAVYFGLPNFSARQRATNFSLEELPEVFEHLHAHNVRGYVAFNTLLFPDELPDAATYVRALAGAGADAVIVQDLGLARLVRWMVPALPIHASTQTTQTDPHGIELLRGLGVQRTILARELSIAQIGRIARHTDMELEVFVHGALCVSYSGQCLASEALWGRSANRGLCAQPCRLPYELVVDGRPRDPGDRAYLWSMPDLCAWDRVPELVKLGVVGLKIEGRLKSAEYVAAATRVYRAALDAALEGRPFDLGREERQQLVQSFSRGFTHGFLDGPDHQATLHARFARHLGVQAGTVAGRTGNGVLVRLDPCLARSGAPLKAGDGVVFADGRLHQDQQGGRIYAIDPHPAGDGSGEVVEVKFRASDVDLASIPDGVEVRRTDDPGLRRELKRSFSRDVVARRTPLTMRVIAVAGRPLTLSAVDDTGLVATATWDGPLAPSRQHPLTTQLLREQLGRLGTTPFVLADLGLEGLEGPAAAVEVMVPKSVLNDLRRTVVDTLMDLRRRRTCHAIVEPAALDAMRQERCPGLAAVPEMAVLARTPEQVDGILAWEPPPGAARLGLVYLELYRAEALDRARSRLGHAGTPVGLVTGRTRTPGSDDDLARAVAAGPDAVLVRNLGSLALLRAKAPGGVVLVGVHSL
ncbi:MAG: U32 family peptidase, partial [Candidatus Riflebacteria bacterium]|nr:U32 family peptidase [Candidatus Riflebacteria bacterium]